MAAGLLRRDLDLLDLTDAVEIGSAGIACRSPGEGADARAARATLARGVDISGHRQRAFAPEDFHRFDLILAMDRETLVQLLELAPDGTSSKIRLLMEFARRSGRDEVPDPWAGASAEYELALELISAGVQGLVLELAAHCDQYSSSYSA